MAKKWLGCMSHMRAFVATHPCLSIHMRDFVHAETRSQVVRAVLRHLGVANTPEVMQQALKAFQSNSQKGSTMQKSSHQRKGSVPPFLSSADLRLIGEMVGAAGFSPCVMQSSV